MTPDAIRGRRRLPAVLVGLAICGVSTLAYADPKEDARARAREGTTAFNLAHYTEAAEHFEAAYRIVPEPVLLFDLGQAYRMAGRPEKALASYRAFLRTAPPNATNREQVEKRISELEKVIADARGGTAVPPPTGSAGPRDIPAQESAVALAQPPRHEPDQHRTRWWLGRRWFWVAAGSAAVFAAGATIAGVSMGARFDELNSSCGSKSPTRPGCPEPDIGSVATREHAANTLWALTGVAAVAGGALFYIEGRNASVEPAITGSAIGLVGRGCF